MIIAGGDEAGRGAVLGPLVVSIVAIGKNREKRLAEIGVRDSKQLSKRQREFLFGEIYNTAEEVAYYAISNEEINAAMQSGISLNELEALHFAKLVDSLNSSVKRLYIDSPDVLPWRFGVRMGMFAKKTLITARAKAKDIDKSKQESTAIRVTAEHKADVKYPIVSAASIVSKVIRDREIERIRQELGIMLGSGYPSDHFTITALKENLENRELQSYVRQKWQTLKHIRQKHIEEFLSA
ncbi:MAG: ribonuclease HII [Candidatus Micrarchaeaceae archaeon]